MISAVAQRLQPDVAGLGRDNQVELSFFGIADIARPGEMHVQGRLISPIRVQPRVLGMGQTHSEQIDRADAKADAKNDCERGEDEALHGQSVT